jgi:hypothetical protein
MVHISTNQSTEFPINSWSATINTQAWTPTSTFPWRQRLQASSKNNDKLHMTMAYSDVQTETSQSGPLAMIKH